MDVRQIRDAMGITRQQLAERMEITRQTVANWEKNKAQPSGPARVLLAIWAAETAIKHCDAAVVEQAEPTA